MGEGVVPGRVDDTAGHGGGPVVKNACSWRAEGVSWWR